jgi:hypothetical protein
LLAQPHDILFDCFRFQIDGDEDIFLAMVGNQGQDFLNGRNLFASERRVEPTSGVELADLVEGQVSHFARSVRGAIHRVIVDADQMPIFGALYVELEAETQFKAGSEIRQRVFRGLLEKPSVSDDQRGPLLGNGAGMNCQKKKRRRENAESGGHVCSPLNAPEP